MSDPRPCSECGAPLEPRQEYCLECGARATEPPPRPPHWLWPAAAAALVAAGGAAAAIAAGGGGSDGTPTIVALSPLRPVSATVGEAPLGARPVLRWPARDGYTVVLAAVPETAGSAVATARAHQAIAAGLPEVGVLESRRYASLHPGYTLVFSGIYATRDEALLALPKVARRFRSAYAQEIVR